MDHEKAKLLNKALLEGTAEGVVETARASCGLAIDLVVVMTASEIGLATHVLANTGALGPLPSGAIESLHKALDAAIDGFLRQCPSIEMKRSEGGDTTWKSSSN